MGILGRELRMGQKAQRAQTIVDGHENDAPAIEALSVELRLSACAAEASAAVHPEEDWELLSGVLGGGPDVQIQAVLTARVDVLEEFASIERFVVADGLLGNGAKFGAQAHALPGLHRLGCAPAQRTHRWRRVGDALEDGINGVVAPDAAEASALDGHFADGFTICHGITSCAAYFSAVTGPSRPKGSSWSVWLRRLRVPPVMSMVNSFSLGWSSCATSKR